MRTTVTAARGARLLLLVGTLLGLAAMHTIGHDSHPTGHSVDPSAHAAAAHAAAPVVAPRDTAPRGPHAAVAPSLDIGLPHAAVAALQAVVGCSGGCVPDRLLPSGGTGGEMPGWGACLAVLGAFAASLVLAALLSARVRAVGPAGGGPVGSLASPRAPPPRPVGLRLATVSVLRR
ncbi:hypothetical protein KBX06_06070 [Micromonospora sp. C31]|uniref:hypothetical protein n=1 Tax=Micromonospora sp. C31 TaxID=2824876 RepID=UPI001B380E5C|nr:hypothetical protein [Micromonospora sp. C31]MBQ1072734.1 hypothetical protein [Micromonospora sp. C31]